MSRRIPQTFIHELIARADLLDVIGARVTLKKAGGSYKGLCPFHDEKTPSFTVSPDKGFYHCFGCGAHGNAIDFVIAYENRSFPEAVEALADMLHLEVPLEARDEQQPEADGLFAILREADQIYRRSLREHPAAIAYLKNRGIDGGTAAKFGLGYAPDAWDTLVRALGASARGLETLVEAGLAKVNEQGRRYDTFRDRIMFPIRDSRGRVIGFGGRVLGSGEPKYMNSPETPVFHKRQALYGIYEARQRPGRPEEILVVEGYLDVAALAQYGIEPAMATLGTATTGEHIRQLTRLSNRVVFCFDGDRAGRAAAWRAAEAALPFGGGSVEIGFLLLPEGEDPDSFVRSRGADAFRAALSGSLPLSTFLLHELRSQVQLNSSDGRAKLIALVRPLLARLPDGVYRELLTAELAELVGMTPERFRAVLDPGLAAGRPAKARRASTDRSRTLMRKLITLIVHYPRAAGRLAPVDGIEEVDVPGADLLRRLLEMTANEPQLMSAQLIEAFRDDPEGRHLQRLAVEVPLDDEPSATSVLADGLANLVAAQRKLTTAAAVKRGSASRGAGSVADSGEDM
jgi:DNA primase